MLASTGMLKGHKAIKLVVLKYFTAKCVYFMWTDMKYDTVTQVLYASIFIKLCKFSFHFIIPKWPKFLKYNADGRDFHFYWQYLDTPVGRS